MMNCIKAKKNELLFQTKSSSERLYLELKEIVAGRGEAGCITKVADSVDQQERQLKTHTIESKEENITLKTNYFRYTGKTHFSPAQKDRLAW